MARSRSADNEPDALGATGDEAALTTQVEKFGMCGELAVYHLLPFWFGRTGPLVDTAARTTHRFSPTSLIAS